MVAYHLRMLLCELESLEEESKPATPMYFKSKMALAMGKTLQGHEDHPP